MKTIATPALIALVLLAGCNQNPPSREEVRRSTAEATQTVASTVKGAAEGIRDGIKNAKNNVESDSVDVNSASKASLMLLPGVTAATADRIIENRPYDKPGDLVRRKIVSRDVYAKIDSRIVAR